jgi:hypothetical protein
MCHDEGLTEKASEVLDEANKEAYELKDIDLVMTSPYIVPSALINTMMDGSLLEKLYSINLSANWHSPPGNPLDHSLDLLTLKQAVRKRYKL